jgi:opacity protein-like surface antigen
MQSTSCRALITLLGVCGLLAMPTSAAAQAFGIGARIANIRSDATSDSDSVRFIGGQIRLGLSERIGVEVSLDRHTESLEALNERVKEYPLQASLLLRLAGGGFQPYLLAGPGWYTRRVEPLDGAAEDGITTRKFGWHGGFGAEIRMGRHAGLHGDYRYTFLDFNDDEDEEASGFVTRLLPGYKGSMWTVGATVYF